MKGLSELIAENDALVAKRDAARAASFRRLKQRLGRWLWSDKVMRRRIYEAVDEWVKCEQRKGLP